jgi:hypothetical protein
MLIFTVMGMHEKHISVHKTESNKRFTGTWASGQPSSQQSRAQNALYGISLFEENLFTGPVEKKDSLPLVFSSEKECAWGLGRVYF